MTGWYQIISFLFTNGLRIFLCLYLVMKVLKLSGDRKKAGVLSACAAVFITLLSCLPAPPIFIAGAEMVIIMLILRHLFRAGLRMPLFLMFFYEMTVALWEFMISAGLGIAFRSENFLNRNAPEYKETGRKGCGAAFPSCPAFCGYNSVFISFASVGRHFPKKWPCSRESQAGRRASQTGINSTSAMHVLLADVAVNQQPDFF